MPSHLPPDRRGRRWRFFPVGLFFVAVMLCFLGGVSALLFELFAQSELARNSWLLVCGAPGGVVIMLAFLAFNLYTRFGRPLQDIFNAIDSVAEGDLSVRVAADDSPQFGELIKRFNKMVGELERAEQQRRNLTADVAHELRTPLHIIQGNLEGVLDGVYQPTTEHINATLDETRLLTRLVNDLQTLSLAETGQLPLHPTQFLVADLLADVETSFSSQAVEQQVQLQVEIDAQTAEAQFTADYDRLNQVLSNLVSNALRYTPTGGQIRLTAAQLEGQLKLNVSDTGSGIPAEDLPFIFDRFWKGDRSRTRGGHHGSGLGLAISRQLVRAHGGTLEAASQPGQGTSFEITLPLAQTITD